MVSPGVILSRVLAFVLAAQMVVAVVLWIALENMFPLTKKQIFFVSESDRFIQVAPYFPDARNLQAFKENFIREYIRERLGILPSQVEMSRRWGANGRVAAWSNPQVYRDFVSEKMTIAVLSARPNWVRRVNFLENPTPRGNDTYAVKVRVVDEDGAGQTIAKDFTIIIRLQFEDRRAVLWDDRLKNPFGAQVAEFRMESQADAPDDKG